MIVKNLTTIHYENSFYYNKKVLKKIIHSKSEFNIHNGLIGKFLDDIKYEKFVKINLLTYLLQNNDIKSIVLITN